MHPLITSALGSVLPVRFLVITIQACRQNLPMQMNKGNTRPKIKTLQLVICSCNTLIELNSSFKAGGRMSFFITFQPDYLSNKQGALNRTYDVAPIQLRHDKSGCEERRHVMRTLFEWYVRRTVWWVMVISLVAANSRLSFSANIYVTNLM